MLPPETARKQAFAAMVAAGVPLAFEEQSKIEVTDFGLKRFDLEGACIATLISTERYALKAIWLHPSQRLPEHKHPRVGHDRGKLETIRIAAGRMRLFREAMPEDSRGEIVGRHEEHYTCPYAYDLERGGQHTLQPGERHSFHAGENGTVLYSVSSTVRDGLDEFTNPHVVR